MKRTRWFEPYQKQGNEYRPAMSDKWTDRRAGVYFIRSQATGELCYIGHSSSQLKKTIYRHFQAWPDRTQHRTWYEKTGFEIRFIYTTAAQAPRLERFLIRKYKPRDNEQKYRTFWEEISDPQEKKIKALAKDAEMAPFLKKADYIEDFSFSDDGTETRRNRSTAADEEAPF